MIHRFGSYELSQKTRQLRDADGPIHVEPQVFDVLTYLVTHRDRVVSKEELLDAVWQSRFVSESALTSRIKAIRSAVGDSGRAQHTIQTIHGTGYRFVADVIEIAPADDGPGIDFVGSTTGMGSTPRGGVQGGPLRRIPAVANQLRGRRSELQELGNLLADERLVTILGPGGTGKTRLSIELAQDLGADESVVFVNLAPVRDEQALGSALATAVDIDAGVVDDVIGACCAYLRSHSVLLIVDNCEHVVRGAAALVERVLHESPNCTVLATSRTRKTPRR